jgi:hypothetical protein
LIDINRLYSKDIIHTPVERYELILWVLTGEAENLKNDIHFDEKDYLRIEATMKDRANRMRSQLILYDHKDFKFLKSTTELQFEYEHLYPDDTPAMIQERIKNFVGTDLDIEVVTPKPITEAGDASTEELKSLVHQLDGRNVLLGRRCFVRSGAEYDWLTFDHLEPCSQVQFVDGGYSIGNIQVLSRCINYVKGNYTEKELVHWLAKILDTYEERYSEKENVAII